MFAVSLGLMAVVPALPLYLQEEFGIRDPASLRSWSGIVFAAGPLAAAIMGPVWGVLGDRLGRKPMVVRAALAISLVMGAMPLAPSPVFMVLLRVLQGALAGYIAPALVLGIQGVPVERQGHAIGRLQLALAMGLLVGPVVGAEVAVSLGRKAVFLMTAGLALVSVVPVIFLAREDRETLAPRRGVGLWAQFHGDLRALFQNRVFRWLLALLLLLRFGQQMVEPYVALWVQRLGPLPWIASHADDLQVATERSVGLAYAVVALGQLLFAPLWGRLADRWGPLRLLATVALALAAVFFVTAGIRHIEGFMVVRALAAVFMAGSMTLAYSAAARRVPPERRSLSFSMVQSCMQYGLALGPVLGNVLAGPAGVPGLYVWAGACLCLAGAGMLMLRLFGVRRATAE